MSAWQRIWRQIETLGLPILLALGIGVIFASPDQIHEVYRAAAQAFATSRSEQAADYRELICAAAGIFAVSLALWLAGRQIETAARDLQFGQAVQPGWVTQWIPRVLALVPPLAAAVGVTLARVSPAVESSIKSLMSDVFYEQFKTDGSSDVAARALATEAVSGLQSFNELLSIFSLCLIGGAALTLGIVWLLDYVSGIRDFLRPQRLYKSWVSLLFALFGFAIVIVFVTVPVELPQWIGIIGLLGLFLSFVLVAIAQLYSWGRQINTPLITILLLLALGFSAFDLNDNHTIRNSPTAVVRPPEPPKLDAAFERWFKSREDKDAFKERPYPIYVVAAQGGGIYAAHHVAGFLSDVQDLCPGFSHHLFAISGVSGGSVGASVFAGVTRDLGKARAISPPSGRCYDHARAKRRSTFSDVTEATFKRDLLSPLAASLFFPDFLQRFVPASLPMFDRARALEFALEAAYARGVSESGLGKHIKGGAQALTVPFAGHWDPARYPHTPALVLNTTDVETGERLVVSPFEFQGAGLRFLPLWGNQSGAQQAPVNPPVSTAALLSARFPWVTPAAWFNRPSVDGGTKDKGKKVRVVDGGYFENSGVATAVDLISGILASAKRQKIERRIEIVLIVFSSANFQKPRAYGLAETLEPIRAMLNTRSARAGIEIGKAIELLNSWSRDGVTISARMIKLELQGHGYPLPLGWRLSDVTRHLISYQNGLALTCSDTELKAAKVGKGIAAGCAKKLMFDQLR